MTRTPWLCVLLLVPQACAQAPSHTTLDSDTTLDNGLRVIVVDRPALPLVTFALYLRGGLMLDSRATFRHSSLTMGCLWMGHRGLDQSDRDEDAVRGALADVGAEYGSYVDLQDTRVHLSCLAPQAETGLTLFADALLQPTFAEEVVAREREQERRTLLQRSKEPAFLAQQAFVRAVAGEHPLADAFVLSDGDGALARADRATLHTAWLRMVQPQLGTLFVVGRVTPALADAVRARFGAWQKASAPTTIAVAAPTAKPDGRVFKVPLPEMTQVYLQLGMLGPAPQDPIAPTMHVLRLAIAGGFTSALTDELRVNRGLVYEISFTHPTLSFAPPFSLATQTRADQVADVLDVTVRTLRGARHDGLRDAQVEAARNLWLGTRAIERETQLGVADAMHRSLRLFGDFDGRAREAAVVRATTLADVRRAAARFDPAHCVVVMVGAPEDLAKIDWRLPD